MAENDEREAHRDEVIKVARKVVNESPPAIFGLPNPHIKALREELEALDQYELRHPRGVTA